MVQRQKKLLTTLLSDLRGIPLDSAVERMWKRGLLNQSAVERLYINNEVDRRVRAGQTKVRVLEQLSKELGCSYEKVRHAVYCKTI